MIGEGSSVHGAWAALEAAKIPPPRGVRWQRTFVRGCIFDDVYKPHSFEEVAALISPEVAARLDPSKYYGVWWYNRSVGPSAPACPNTLLPAGTAGG
jgi:hypothetical protein